MGWCSTARTSEVGSDWLGGNMDYENSMTTVAATTFTELWGLYDSDDDII